MAKQFVKVHDDVNSKLLDVLNFNAGASSMLEQPTKCQSSDSQTIVKPNVDRALKSFPQQQEQTAKNEPTVVQQVKNFLAFA